MEYLSWDLSILSRAIAYTNLSAASSHVGLSQPQLSRIVAKLEEQLGLTLLDRETRRKSSWTPAAYRLAEIYTKTFQGFRSEIASLAGGSTPHELRVGTLEGLVDKAMEFCRAVLDKTKVMVVQLEVLDTSFLDERFAKGDLDLMLTAREWISRKYRFSKLLGYQCIDVVSQGEMKVHSTFEYASTVHKGIPTEKAFVSNSLRVRQDWIASYGGTGTLPSAVRAKKGGKTNEVTVMVVAHDNLPVAFWEEIAAFL